MFYGYSEDVGDADDVLGDIYIYIGLGFRV